MPVDNKKLLEPKKISEKSNSKKSDQAMRQ